MVKCLLSACSRIAAHSLQHKVIDVAGRNYEHPEKGNTKKRSLPRNFFFSYVQIKRRSQSHQIHMHTKAKPIFFRMLHTLPYTYINHTQYVQ